MLSIVLTNNHQPLYTQIYEHIKNIIIKGYAKANTKLPSKRSLAANLSVSINTVDAAYSQLISEGYICAKPKSGHFVCEIDEYFAAVAPKVSPKLVSVAKPPIKIDFSPDMIDYRHFPYEIWRKTFKYCFNEYDDGLLKRPPVQGDITLRENMVDFLYNSRKVSCTAEQIVISIGSSGTLQILAAIFGRERYIACENPVYMRVYKVFQNLGNKVLAVDVDEKGLQVDLLKKFKQPLAIFVTPSHHFPLGSSMPVDRRVKLLNFANKHKDCYVIEDDYDSEFRYSGKPLPSLHSLDNNKVIYIGTFSKALSPSIRIGYMVLPLPLLRLYQSRLTDIGVSVSGVEQKMLAHFIATGNFEKHINKMRKIYKEKRKLLEEKLSAMSNIKISGDKAGHHFLVQHDNLSEEQLCCLALKHGIKVYPISAYFIKHSNVPANTVLLGYAGLDYDEISTCVELLKKAWGNS